MDLILAASAFSAPNSAGISAFGSARAGDEGADVHEVSLGLAKALHGLGHRVTLVAPYDPAQHASLGLARKLTPLKFPVGAPTHERVMFDTKLPSGVELTLLGGEPPREATGTDRTERYAWFGHAVATFALHRLGQAIEGASELEAIVTVGEAAAFTNLAVREAARWPHEEGKPSPRMLAGLSRVAVVLDPSRDLRLPRERLAAAGIDPALFTTEGLEFYGQASLLKGGAVGADRVAWLGAEALAAARKPGVAHKLDGFFRARDAALLLGGGLDVDAWDPNTDPLLPFRYDAEEPGAKWARLRPQVLSELELDPDPQNTFLVVLGHLDAAQEAVLAATLPRALRGPLVVVRASAGPVDETGALARLERAHAGGTSGRGRVRVKGNVSEAVLRRLLAAADFSLVLGDDAAATAARAALRYGTLPVVSPTPAHTEAVVDLLADDRAKSGHGVVLAGVTEPDLFAGIQRAESLHTLPHFHEIARRAMRLDLGFGRAARRLSRELAALEG
ncbi:MAG: hypothetical protein JNL79_36220 [Myxococcales bacterium]|nr:hypothetical protein [Myxococcales bacterium]